MNMFFVVILVTLSLDCFVVRAQPLRAVTRASSGARVNDMAGDYINVASIKSRLDTNSDNAVLNLDSIAARADETAEHFVPGAAAQNNHMEPHFLPNGDLEVNIKQPWWKRLVRRIFGWHKKPKNEEQLLTKSNSIAKEIFTVRNGNKSDVLRGWFKKPHSIAVALLVFIAIYLMLSMYSNHARFDWL